MLSRTRLLNGPGNALEQAYATVNEKLRQAVMEGQRYTYIAADEIDSGVLAEVLAEIPTQGYALLNSKAFWRLRDTDPDSFRPAESFGGLMNPGSVRQVWLIDIYPWPDSQHSLTDPQ